MKALPLPSPKVLLSSEYKRYYGQLRLPYGPNGTSFPYIHPLLPCTAPVRCLPCYPIRLPLRVTPATPEAHQSVLAVFVKTDAPAFPSGQKGQRLRLRFRGYIWVRFRCNPQVCSAHFLGLCQGTMCFGLPLAPPSSYMGELPNSHGRTLTDESYVIHGILSGTESRSAFVPLPLIGMR